MHQGNNKHTGEVLYNVSKFSNGKFIGVAQINGISNIRVH